MRSLSLPPTRALAGLAAATALMLAALAAHADRLPPKPFVDDDRVYDAPGRTAFKPHREPAALAMPSLVRLERDSRSRLDSLFARSLIADPTGAAAIAREIEAEKRAQELELLGLRAERARNANAPERAATLQRRIDLLRFHRGAVRGGGR